MHFGARHAEGVVLGCGDGLERLPEARPAGAALVFWSRTKTAAARSRRRRRCRRDARRAACCCRPARSPSWRSTAYWSGVRRFFHSSSCGDLERAGCGAGRRYSRSCRKAGAEGGGADAEQESAGHRRCGSPRSETAPNRASSQYAAEAAIVTPRPPRSPRVEACYLTDEKAVSAGNSLETWRRSARPSRFRCGRGSSRDRP